MVPVEPWLPRLTKRTPTKVRKPDIRRAALLALVGIGSAAVAAGGVRSLYTPTEAGAIPEPPVTPSRVMRPRSMPLVTAPPAFTRHPLTSPTPSVENPSTSRQRAATYYGHLIIDSVPRGALVLINQQQAGVTPLELQRYPVGSHAVWVQGEAHRRWSAGVRVTANTITRVMATLEATR